MAYHDVIIAGAGPAGSMCAHEMGSRGMDILLLDKEKFPRYKPCGGGVVRKAMAFLNEQFGESTEDELNRLKIIENRALNVHFNHHRIKHAFEVERMKPVISMVNRQGFDQWLLDKALKKGIRFRDECNVLTVEKNDRIKVGTDKEEYHCRFLVLAMGWNGMGPGWLKQYRTIMPALECKIVTDRAHMEQYEGTARFDLGIPERGYAWLFPRADHLSLGVLTSQRKKINLKNYIDQYLGFLGLEHAGILEQYGSVIPVSPRENLFKDPVILYVGDAAGLADPVVAEGITHALQSGWLAAQALAEAGLDKSRVQKLYGEKLKMQILPQLRVARFLSGILYGQIKVSDLAFKRIGPELADSFASVFEGKRNYPSGLKEYAKPIWKIIAH